MARLWQYTRHYKLSTCSYRKETHFLLRPAYTSLGAPTRFFHNILKHRSSLFFFFLFIYLIFFIFPEKEKVCQPEKIKKKKLNQCNRIGRAHDFQSVIRAKGWGERTSRFLLLNKVQFLFKKKKNSS